MAQILFTPERESEQPLKKQPTTFRKTVEQPLEKQIVFLNFVCFFKFYPGSFKRSKGRQSATSRILLLSTG